MKKLLFAIFIVLSTIMQAQDVNWGVKLGGTLASTHFNDEIPSILSNDNSVKKPGFQLGVFARKNISTKFTFQLELNYALIGDKYKITSGIMPMTGTVYLTYAEYIKTLHYLQLPFLIQYHAGNKVNFETGPQLGYLISAKTHSTSEYSDGKVKTLDQDETKYFNALDFGWNLGVNYQFAKKYFINIKYTFGLVSILDADPQFNRVGQIGIGYFFSN